MSGERRGIKASCMKISLGIQERGVGKEMEG